jgi:hypothetical protein
LESIAPLQKREDLEDQEGNPMELKYSLAKKSGNLVPKTRGYWHLQPGPHGVKRKMGSSGTENQFQELKLLVQPGIGLDT